MKKVKILTDEYSQEFNKLVEHPMQSWDWGEFKKKFNGIPVRIGFFEDEKMVDGVQIIFSKLPKTRYTIGYVPKGIMPNNMQIEALKKIGKEQNAIFIKVEPNYYLSVDSNPMENQQLIFSEQSSYLFSHKARLGNPFFTKYDFHLDISLSEDELMKSFHSKTRYNTRLAEKRGVQVIENSSLEGIENYIRLMQETTARQGFFNHNAKYFRELFKSFPKGQIRIFEAHYEGEVLTAWILFCFNGKLYYPYGASSNKHRNVMPNNLVLWKAVQEGKKLGYTEFDLWGCLGPNPDESDPWFGFHKFKSGYNPQLVEYVGTFDFVYKPLLYKLFNIANKIRWKMLRWRRS